MCADQDDAHPFVRDERLRREERLRRRGEFLTTQRRGGRHVGSCLIVYACRGDQPWSRLGLTVSRKVGGSVTRNRVKRRLREAFRRNKTRLPLGFDLVVIARPHAAAAGLSALERELIDVAGRAAGRFGQPRRRGRDAKRPGS